MQRGGGQAKAYTMHTPWGDGSVDTSKCMQKSHLLHVFSYARYFYCTCQVYSFTYEGNIVSCNVSGKQYSIISSSVFVML